MKLKKILYILSLIILITFIVFFSLNIYKNVNKDKTILLGNNIELIKENVDDTFTSSFMTSTLLLKMIESDASKDKEGKIVKLSNLIKESKEIIINIGSVDLCNYIKDEDGLIYDEIILKRKSEIIESNIYNIVKLINNKSNNTNILVCEISYPYTYKDDALIKIFDELNAKINKIIDKIKEECKWLTFNK